MRVPIRKGGQYTFMPNDPKMTEAKLNEFKKSLVHLKKDIQPPLIQEVKRLSLLGDFSENAEYQIAKGRLRSTNQKILKLEQQIATAQIIKFPQDKTRVQIGSSVTVVVNEQEYQYHILGSAETNPATGTISYQSPLGLALLNKKVNDVAELKLADRTVNYKIIKIN